MLNRKQLLPLLIPFTTACLIFYLIKINYPTSITGIDPEYVCLLNGLNVSMLQFDNIGFTDSPGTPFIVLAGILIRIVHTFLGKGPIFEDVISRPDFYFQSTSFLLLFLTFLVLIWGGRKIYKATKNEFAVILTQSVFLLSPISTMLQFRFSMDRLLPIISFILTVYIVLLVQNQIKERKFAIIAGIIMGVGFITKFNFVVLGIIPLVLFTSFRSWIIYGFSFICSAIISFLPIIDKYQNFVRFIKRLIFYQGTYGGGDEGMFNFNLLLEAFRKMAELNYVFVFIIFFSLAVILFTIFKKGQFAVHKKHVLLLITILLATIIEIILASKIFKNSYMAPVVAMSGILFFVAWKLFISFFKLNKNLTLVSISLILILLSLPTFIEAKSISKITQNRISERLDMASFIENKILSEHYLLIEPTWKAGPSPLNGIVYGLSYIASRYEYAESLIKKYPRVLTYENDNKPFKHLRTKDANIENIFTEDNSVYLISTPIRKTAKVMQELKDQAAFVNMRTQFDTVFSNANDHIIRTKFIQLPVLDSFKTITFFNNMEDERKNWKQNAITNDNAFSGKLSTRIKKGNKYSSVCEIDSVHGFADEIHTLEVSCQYFQKKTNNSRMVIELFNQKNERLWYPVFCMNYFEDINKWSKFSYKLYVPRSYRTSKKINIYFYNSSKTPVYIDDVCITLTYKEKTNLLTTHLISTNKPISTINIDKT